MKYGLLASLLMAGAAAKNGQVEEVQKYVWIVEGFLTGTIDAEGFNDIERCIQDGTGIINEAEDAIAKFQKKDLKDIIAGIEDVADIIKLIQEAMKDCSDIKADWEKLEKIALTFKSPVSFAWHVGGDIIHNGVQITKEIETAVSDYKSEQWFYFGKNCGEAAAHVFLGSQKSEKQETVKSQTLAYKEHIYPNEQRTKIAEFLQGFFKATNVGTFNPTNLLQCLQGMSLDVVAFYEAFDSLESGWENENWVEVIAGAVMLAASVGAFEVFLPVCEAIETKSHNWSDLNNLIATTQDQSAFKIVENNIVFNGKTITAEFITAMESYKLGKYEEFGFMLGQSMTAAFHQQKYLFLY